MFNVAVVCLRHFLDGHLNFVKASLLSHLLRAEVTMSAGTVPVAYIYQYTSMYSIIETIVM